MNTIMNWNVMTKPNVTDIQKHIGTNPMRLIFLCFDQFTTPENPNINTPDFELK